MPHLAAWQHCWSSTCFHAFHHTRCCNEHHGMLTSSRSYPYNILLEPNPQSLLHIKTQKVGLSMIGVMHSEQTERLVCTVQPQHLTSHHNTFQQLYRPTMVQPSCTTTPCFWMSVCAHVCLLPIVPVSQVVHVSCLVQGAAVAASDISSSMANEAKRRYEEAVSSGQQAPSTAPTFSATDLESITGSFHTVVCLDVMIHYPQASHVVTRTGFLPFCCLY